MPCSDFWREAVVARDLRFVLDARNTGLIRTANLCLQVEMWGRGIHVEE